MTLWVIFYVIFLYYTYKGIHLKKKKTGIHLELNIVTVFIVIFV